MAGGVLLTVYLDVMIVRHKAVAIAENIAQVHSMQSARRKCAEESVRQVEKWLAS